MKKILLFGAGKSATVLIDYLSRQCQQRGWHLLIADADIVALQEKIAGHPATQAIALGVEDEGARGALIMESDLVISLLPATLHYLIAKDCIVYHKNLLTASYVDDQIRGLATAIKDNHLVFLAEMGLDPGIDHMSAMQLIDRIKQQGGVIDGFRSHTGGLVAPESDTNPWHYKISWNPRNVVRAGSAGALFKLNGQLVERTYESLYDQCETVTIPEAGRFAFYPNRDSLAYIPVYGLEQTKTFVRTTLRHPDFCDAWKFIVAAGLTDDQTPLNDQLKGIKAWASGLMKTLPDKQLPMFEFLGFDEDAPIPVSAKSSADVLQQILESKWKMEAGDKDMIVMLHEISYHLGNESHRVTSSLVVTGDDHIRTAMAKTVGLPLGIAAVLILENKLSLTGLHIPILPEIYQPVLAALEEEGIRFSETLS